MKTLKERNIEALTERLGREPTEFELGIKEVAEREAANQIDATPSGEYVMEEIVEEHWEAVAKELGTFPLEEHKDLFKEIYTEKVENENVQREMRM